MRGARGRVRIRERARERESERDEALPTVLVLVRFALVALVVVVTPLVVVFALTVVVGSVTRAFCLHAQLLLLRCLSRSFCCCCCHGNANANLPTVLHCVQCCFWNITNFMAFNWNFICQLMKQHTSYAICSPSLPLPLNLCNIMALILHGNLLSAHYNAVHKYVDNLQFINEKFVIDCKYFPFLLQIYSSLLQIFPPFLQTYISLLII